MDIGTCPVCFGEYWDVVEHMMDKHEMTRYGACHRLGRVWAGCLACLYAGYCMCGGCC